MVHILLVEDERILARELKNRLESMGYSVLEICDTGKAAVDQAEKKSPDLILMDIRLKGKMDGIEAAQIIHKSMDIPIIYLTAYADKETLKRAKITEPFGYLLKPFISEELHAAIETSLYKYKMDKRLKKSEEKYRKLFEESRDAIYITSQKHKLLDVNQFALDLFGYTREEMFDMDEKILYIHSDDLDRVHQKIELNGSVKEYEIELCKKDGTRILCLITATIRRTSHGNILGHQGIIRDITRRKQAEEEKEKFQNMLLQSQKMEAIGTLAGGIAHDFNNILTCIRGYVQLSLEDVLKKPQTYDNLKQVLLATDRAKDLVNQILTFSRQSEQERIPVRISQIVEEVTKLLSVSLPATIKIRRKLKAKKDIVLADKIQIHQVLLNLCTNAAHAMGEKGGIIEIDLTNIGFDSDELAGYPNITRESYLKLSIRDTGCGMDPATISRIFEPFFTTKKQNEGTGLGLAVVHGIVQEHDGIITVDSKPGQGTTFHVYLPEIKQDKQLKTESREPIIGGNERILFVDDEKDLVYIGKTRLERLGYKVVALKNSLRALEIFRAKPKRFDLVITDQTMPDMTGIQLTEKLRNIRPDIPVILCTGFSAAVDSVKARSAGINEILMKPVLENDLAKVVRHLLDNTNKEV